MKNTYSSSSWCSNLLLPSVSAVLKATLVVSLSITAIACSQPDSVQPQSGSHQSEALSDKDHQAMSDQQHKAMSHQQGEHGQMTHEDMNSHEPAEALGQDYSIYQVGGDWTDHKGNKFQLDDLTGKNQVVIMAYTSCQHTCPILVRSMKRIENEMTDAAKANTEFVLATLDTERDTVSVMNNYAEHNDLGDNWRLIRSDAATTRMLANTLNIKYQFADNGDINHSNLISVLDTEGRLVAQEIGVVKGGIKPLVEYLNSHS